MMVVSTDGYIIAALGPNFADSKNYYLNPCCPQMSKASCNDDVLVVDFWDSFCTRLDFKTEMPYFLKIGK